MAFRFFRRVKLAPGLSLNLSKSGGSLSFGPRGAKCTVGSSGVRSTVGIPGTGLYYTEHSKRKLRAGKGGSTSAYEPATDPSARLDLGFFKRLFTPVEERHFVAGMQHVLAHEDDQALATLDQPDAVADALFMAAVLALKHADYKRALSIFERAEAHADKLGTYFDKYGLSAAANLPVTHYITATIEPHSRGMALARVEAEQALGDWQAAQATLCPLYETDPADPVVLLSLVELLVEDQADKAAYQRVVEITAGTDNNSELAAAALYRKGQALHRLGLLTAARDALSAAFRRKKNRDPELLRAIQYERAQVYDALGKHSRAREEFGCIYAEDPTYADVATRI